MRTLNLVGSVAFSLACLIAGVRLLLLARRTGQFPEAIMGVSFLCGGALGHTLFWLLPLLPVADGARVGLSLLARLFVAAGCGTMLYFTWRVFRPGRSMAGVAFGFFAALLGVYVFRDQLFARAVELHEIALQPLYWCGAIAQMIAYAWPACETFAYLRAAHRRRQLGLALDPMVTLRLAFWTVGMSVAVVLFALVHGTYLAWALTGVRPSTSPSGAQLVNQLGQV
jgi:hypothetical protein